MPTMERVLVSSSANVNNNMNKLNSSDDDSDSDDEIGRMVYNSSRTVQERRAAAAEAAKNNSNNLTSCSPHTSDSNGNSTITTGTKRKRDSAHNDQKKLKNKGHKICSIEGCTIYVQKGGVCWRHGANRIAKTCSHDGFVKGGICVRHGAKRVQVHKNCSSEGCTSFVVKGGVCVRHGATRYTYTCSHEGCTSQAQKGGVCVSGMVQRECASYVLLTDVPTMPGKEEYVKGMGQRSSSAVTKVVPMVPSKEERVSGMVYISRRMYRPIRKKKSL